ncbi:MAG: pyridoxal phosphate-dependent aminotransferase [Deltaproteobacteria bacterium]|nr:pyridoxal phosphate-dependent aminotransferase [Deltaproteobacteria bacterium]
MISDKNKKRVSKRVGQIEISATKEMPIVAAKVGGCVSLGQGIPSFATPKHITEAVCHALQGDAAIGKYSLQTGMPELRREIARTLKREQGIDRDPESEILVTVGGMEALVCAILTLVERGDEVLMPSPTYASHVEQVLLAEGVPVMVPLRTEDWGLDLEALDRAVTPRTRLVVICNPSNPTGAVFSDADMQALGELALRHNLIIISDETYDSIVFDIPRPRSLAADPRFREHVISVASFSKKYALTGWRVGWLSASADWMEQIMKVHDASAICAPTPAQVAALAALQGPSECAEAMRLELHKRRDLCCRRLDDLADFFSYVKPQGAFYVMPRYLFSNAPSKDVALQILHEARVITIPGCTFGAAGEGHLRFSFGGDEAEINEAFDRIEKWLKP